MKKLFLLNVYLFLTFLVSAQINNPSKQIFKLNHKFCKGRCTINYKTNKIQLKINGKCDYLNIFSGSFTDAENQLTITVDDQYKWNHLDEIKIVIINGCFVWDKEYQFCLQ